LGSKFTWDLTHVDLLGNDPVFGPDGDTPYVFTFGGNRQYGGLVGLISSLGRFDDSGTDGTVRWSGMPLDSRKILLDLTSEAATQRLGFVEHNAALTPFIPIDGHDHGSILKEPKPLLIDLVNKALQVTDKASFEAWKSEATQATNDVREKMLKSEAWQQFVIHVSDERGRSIPDWALELFISNTDGAKEERALPVDVHPYRADPSYRCFHVNLSDFWDKKFEDLWIRLSASVGSSLVGYQGFTDESLFDPVSGFWQGRLNLAHLVRENRPTFFYPFTTTLVEIRINRQPALDKLFIF
jgi:hypothetical protein